LFKLARRVEQGQARGSVKGSLVLPFCQIDGLLFMHMLLLLKNESMAACTLDRVRFGHIWWSSNYETSLTSVFFLSTPDSRVHKIKSFVTVFEINVSRLFLQI
jgi:hypothetical protein